MEVIELYHEVCYRSLDELLEDVCPRASIIALSYVKLRSHLTRANPVLAILSRDRLIIVQDIQDAIDYISADNLIVIELSNIQDVGGFEGQLTLRLADDSDMVLEKGRFESAMPLLKGLDTSFSTLCAAIRELLGFEMPQPVQVEVEPVPVPVPAPESEDSTIEPEETPVRRNGYLWLAILLFVVVCGVGLFMLWNNSKQTTPDSESTNIVPMTVSDDRTDENTENSAAITDSDPTPNDSEPKAAASSAQTNVVPTETVRELRVSSLRETMFGEPWPNEWRNADASGKDIRIRVKSKEPMFRIEYSVNGELKQSPFIIYDRARSEKLTKERSAQNPGTTVHSYSNPSSSTSVYVDVITATLDELVDPDNSTATQTVEMNLSVEAAEYAVGFRF
ncbi:MAG: hypothetical protein H6603_06415 [Flavobacteriales bacterium]|nr:hypothetical protein [Flavobacteriales bacterium]MCB9190356.1 hypothetical protein [Flavobacteriales bacterium]MCB9204596.1 hypothetical protein [Flavobacteriales bacterium]